MTYEDVSYEPHRNNRETCSSGSRVDRCNVGVTGIFVRLLPPVSPLAVTAGRLLGALVVALPIFATSKAKRSGLKQAIKKPVGYVLASLLAGYYLLATAAFQLAPVAEVALLLSTPPLFVLGLRRIRGDAPTALELLGAGLAAAGIALVLGPRLTFAGHFGNPRLVGDVLAICAAVLTALYVYLYRHVANNLSAPDPTSVTFMTFALGSVALIAIGCLVPTNVSLATFSGTNLLIFVGLAILCTAIPSFAFAFASERLPSVVTAPISLLIPLFAGAFAFLILGEKVGSTAIPGSVLVVAGIVMILRQNNQIRPSARPIHA
jgi:drug/metabolite transporter (DMT)-like permease